MLNLYEDRTYENIMAECLANAPTGIDVRQGSIFYDAVAAVAFKIAQYYADLSASFDLVFLTTAIGEYLDRKGEDFGLTRNPATPARYEYVFTGAEPPAGTRFFADSLFFVLKRSLADGTLYLEAESPGIGGNNILSGTLAIPTQGVAGLMRSEFGTLLEPGVDAESDESYRRRIQEKIANPAMNGNRQHYKTWCESVAGVGRARIISLFAGENTVMGVIIDPNGLPAAQSVIDRVQEYVDPITLFKTVEVYGVTIPIGDGLGDGVSSIGAHFAAVSPAPVPINISLTAVLKPGAAAFDVADDVSASVTVYLRELTMNTPDDESIVVRISAVHGLLSGSQYLIDYSDLILNGGTVNIEMNDRQIAVLGEVTVNAAV